MQRSQNLPLSPRIYPSFNIFMRLSKNLPLPEYTPFFTTTCICDIPLIYLSLPECTHLLYKVTLRLPESTPPSKNMPLFRHILRIYLPSLSEHIPPLYIYFRPSQNLPLPPRIYPLFKHQYTTLQESTPTTHNIPPPLFLTTLCDTPITYPSLPEYATFLYKVTLPNLPIPLRIYPPFNFYMRPSEKLPLPEYTPSFTTLYDIIPIIYPRLTEYTHLSYKVKLQESTLPTQYIPPFYTKGRSQNLLFPVRCLRITEYTPPSQNNTPF